MGYGKAAVSTRRRGLGLLAGLLALLLSLVLLGTLPLASDGKKRNRDKDDKDDNEPGLVEKVVDSVDETVKDTVDNVEKTVNDATGQGSGDQPAAHAQTANDTGSSARQEASGPSAAQTTSEPETDPPLHGSNPHGQGSVGVVDLSRATSGHWRETPPEPSRRRRWCWAAAAASAAEASTRATSRSCPPSSPVS